MNLYDTDKDFLGRFDEFRTDEVVNEPCVQLDEKDRYMSILAVLLGCQGIEEYKEILEEALKKQVITPIEAKEIVYQAIDYLGIGRVKEFLIVTNEIMELVGVQLPLDSQTTTTMEDRLEKGAQAQLDIFGEGMRDYYKGGHINRWLAANCFGDVYTRTGLDYRQREMITFCYIYAQGGCEPQLMGHIAGNFRMGNNKQFLISVVSQCVPYIGYPRSLNAITCIIKVAKAGSVRYFV